MYEIHPSCTFKEVPVPYHTSHTSHGGDHVFVPFAMEDGGTLGAHAHALLKTPAEHAVSAGCHSSPDSRSPLSPSMQVSLWMQRWQNRLSTWLHVSLSQQILRLYRPAGILSAGL